MLALIKPHWLTAVFLLLLLSMTACERPSDPASVVAANPAAATSAPLLPTPTLVRTRLPQATATATAVPFTPTPTLTPTPFYTGPLSPPCGLSLPLLPDQTEAAVTELSPDAAALTAVEEIIWPSARPALQRLLDEPGTVGLAAYRVGDEANGVYLNADMQMPLASVVKLLPLVAYAEAVAAGKLDPTSTVTLAELEQYYLPGYDLGSHNRAVQELREKGRVLPDPERILLEDVPWMMIRHSSNAAADYLQMRLGQATIEATAVSLGLASQTAPCTWLGQFMVMANHTRPGVDDRQAIEAYLENPDSYGADAALLTDAFVQDEAFRTAENEWHRETRRPSVNTQRFFSHNLNAHGTASEYAALMARLAQNGLSNGDSSFLARRYLEWPMVFPDNQEL
ncbi:MAG TPA: hypothetical protein ENK32_12665, partial [Anaerolineae bacterium]|nr:hypothetical protein [Anaerolineae bacterium]